MTGGAQPQDAAVGSPAPRQKGKATIDTIRIGCTAMVEKEGKPRRAEILSIKETKSGRQFYCNFDNFNKRLDEWVPAARIDFDQEVEWPNPEKPKEPKKAAAPPTKKNAAPKRAQKRLAVVTREPSIASAEDETPRWNELESQKATPDPDVEMRVFPVDLDEATPGPDDEDAMDIEEAAADAVKAEKEAPEQFSREEEIEKLRIGGSMTQNQAEISRIRNISKVQFGEYALFPWYFSPYPEVFSQEDLMYVCEFCLSYYGELKSFTRHRHKCTMLHPPGNEIYRDDYVSFFEIDGRRQRTWCRNLCLFSKMFLDHKTLYYDVDPFLFYVMTTRDEKGCHLVGYFSKEKESADSYNVACILTLPQFQRKGFGRLLIQFSYALTKIEGKNGSPEKPLSDLGLLSYRQYWTETLVELLLNLNRQDDRCSIDSIANQVAMTIQDVESTLQVLKMQVYHKGEHKIVIPTHLIEKHKAMQEKQKTKPKRQIDPARIQWKPPQFTASQRTWGW